MRISDINYACGDKALTGYLADGSTGAPAPGVLLCHRVLPAKALNVLEILPGVVMTVVVWVVMSSAFSIYLVNFNTFASTYASLSGVFAAMFFVYLAALVLILGGEVNRVLEVRRIMRIERSREDAEV